MRKVQQERIFELLKTLQEAHDELGQQSRQGLVATILADCQEFALQIGQYIENIEEKDTKTVALLEEYCELTYKASLESNIKVYIKLLKSHLLKIEKSVRSELKSNKIEVVFFPYLLSMFDALESIYLAAKADPNCDAYVVPIPWFDKLANGELGEMHYDGDRYPDYINVTHWKDYDVVVHHPDIIYIHNPYDGSNHITSVHPDYYSKRLSSYTDCLVYIPYFICTDRIGDYLCSIPGVWFSDKVIVQSETIRAFYVSFYYNYLKTSRVKQAKKLAKNKIVALGSPKIDALINRKKDKIAIPREWKTQIDGKKILFYNTNLHGLLNDGKQTVEKMKKVFKYVQQIDGLTLLWRPHPLNEITCSTMRPQLLKEYLSITKEFKDKQWGIYDDTADLDRAILLSNAYYGNYSSVMVLFMAVQKPIFVKNNEIDIYSKKDLEVDLKYLGFEAFLQRGESVWFSAYKTNGLFRLNLTTMQIEYLGEFPEPIKSHDRLFSKVLYSNEKLFFAPLSGESICIYDIQRALFKTIQLKEPSIKSKRAYYLTHKFYEILKYDTDIFFVGSTYPAIIRYNEFTEELTYFDEWVSELDKLLIDTNMPFFLSGAICRNIMYLPVSGANFIFRFCLDTYKYSFIEIPEIKTGFLQIDFNEGYLWILPKHAGSIIRMNENTGEKEYFDNFPSNYDLCDNTLHQMVVAFGFAWLIPYLGNMVIKLNLQNGSMEEVKALCSVCELGLNQNHYGTQHFLAVFADSKYLYLFSTAKNKLLRYNPSDDSVKELTFCLSEKLIAIFKQKERKKHMQSISMNQKKGNFMEREDCSLEDIVEYIFSEEKMVLENINFNDDMTGHCGENIHKYMVDFFN